MSNNRDTTKARVDARTQTATTQPSNYAATEQDTTTADLSFSIGQFPKSILTEGELISLSQQGDGEAFAHLYDLYVDRIYRYVFFRVSDERVTEDITAHVFMKMWEQLPRYQVGQVPLGGWLYRVAHNAVIDYYRTRKTALSLEEVNARDVRHDDAIDEHLDLQIKLEELRKALQTLTAAQREVLILRFIKGLGVQEIALELGKAPGAIRALQMRGLRELAKSPTLRMESQSYDQ